MHPCLHDLEVSDLLVPESVDLLREGALPRVQLQHLDAPQDLRDHPHALVLLPHLSDLQKINGLVMVEMCELGCVILRNGPMATISNGGEFTQPRSLLF